MYIISSEKAYTYDVLQRDIAALCSEYSFLHPFTLGQSVCGRTLSAIRWGDGEKRLFLNGAHHGMEWITSLLLMKLLEEFCRQKSDDTGIGDIYFPALFHEISLVICPMVNPDGVDLAINGLSDLLPPIIKTRLISYNHGSHDFSKWQANINGVDLNHNYDADFTKGVLLGHQMGIYGPGPTRYSGPEPESEPESHAIASFTRVFLPHVAAAYHTQGEIIYYDYKSKATEQGREMAAAMAEISGYKLDETEGISSCSGYKDWVIDSLGIPAFTFEAGLGENPLPLSQFDTIFHDHLRILLYLVQS